MEKIQNYGFEKNQIIKSKLKGGTVYLNFSFENFKVAKSLPSREIKLNKKCKSVFKHRPP